jgi:membrane protein
MALSALRRHPLLGLLRELWDGTQRHRLTQQAAALTFTTLFALVPLITLALVLIAAVPGAQLWWQDAEAQLFAQLVPTAGDAIRDHLHDFTGSAGGLRSVSLAALALAVFGLARGITQAFHDIWEADDGPSLHKSLVVLFALLLAPLLIAISLALTSFLLALPLIRDVDAALPQGFGLLALVPWAFTVLGFWVLYRLLPPRAALRGRYGCAWTAALVAAVLFELAKRGFALYVGLFPTYELIYGAFSAIPVLLLWLYLSWLIVLFGVELTRALAVRVTATAAEPG